MTIDSIALIRRRKRFTWLRPLLGALVAAVFVYLIVRHMDWAAAGSALMAARKEYLLLALIFLTAGFCTRIVRWWWMLRVLEPKIPLRNCAGPFLSGFALNNVLPLRAGDVARTVGFQNHLMASPMRVLSTLFIERLLDLLVLILFFFIGLSGVSTTIPESFVLMVQWLTAACVVILLGILLLPQTFQKVGNRILSIGPLRRVPLLMSAFDRFSASLALFKSPALMLQLLGFSIVAWLLEGGVFAAVATAVNIGVDPRAPWFALSTGTLATMLPGTPGHVGTFDYFAILGITGYGAPKESAAVFALLVHLTLWLPVTLAGGLYLFVSRRGTETAYAPAGATQE